jgi:hypothetical protein
VKSRSGQDPINFPPKVDNQLTALYGYVAAGDFAPTAGARERLSDLRPELSKIRSRFEEIVGKEVAELNRLAVGLNLPALLVPAKAAATDGRKN